MAADGRDTDFHRGETPIEHVWANPPRGNAPSGTMHPLSDDGPFPLHHPRTRRARHQGWPGHNEQAQVLDPQGRPTRGPYGAGNCVASLAGQAYWGPGGTIGPAVAFGYVAACHAVEQTRNLPD